MALNLDTVFDKLNESVTKLEGEINAHLETMDSSKTEDVMKLQQLMQKWTININATSNVTKSIADQIKSVTDKYRS